MNPTYGRRSCPSHSPPFAFILLLAVSFVSTKQTIGNVTSTQEDEAADHMNEGGKEARVYRGRPVNPRHSRPYVVQVHSRRINGGTLIQQGTIYDEYTVLMTCNGIERSFKIIAGKYFLNQHESSQQERSVCSYSRHPNVAAGGQGILWVYDYGILHLSEPLIFNDEVQPMRRIASSGNSLTNCRLIAWGNLGTGSGRAQPNELREGGVSIAKSNCRLSHSTTICVTGACFYDWGGPVICITNGRETLVGVTSGAFEDCVQSPIADMRQMPRSWFNKELENAKTRCRRPTTTTSTTTTTTTSTSTTTKRA